MYEKNNISQVLKRLSGIINIVSENIITVINSNSSICPEPISRHPARELVADKLDTLQQVASAKRIMLRD